MMKFEFFAARRMMRVPRRKKGARQAGGIGVFSLSVVGVALSLIVMLLSLSIVQGFRRQISSIAYGQVGHISLYPWGDSWLTTRAHIAPPEPFLQTIASEPGVHAIYPIVQQMSLLKTEDDFAGVMLYGVDSAFDYRFFTEAVSGGGMPTFSSLDTIDAPIVLPDRLAVRMKLSLGDKVRLYFLGEKVRVRSFTLAGLYASHGLEDLPALCSSKALRRIDRLSSDSYSRVIIEVSDPDHLDETMARLVDRLSRHPHISAQNQYAMSSAEELLPDLFQWLKLLDSNVVFLIVVMLIVGAFTMITGLIVIVLDKTEHIGLLKAIGASNIQIRRLFALIAMRQIAIGLAIGNALALALSLIQIKWQVLELDPRNYFMDAVPVVIDWELWLGVNLGTLLFIMLAVLGPTMIVARIKPAEIMRID